MKIALVILHADPARGGAERYTVDLAGALARRGHVVHLLAQSFAEMPAGVMPILMPSAMTRTLSYRRLLRGVDAQLDRGGYDVVHAMLPVNRCDVYHPHAGMAAAAMKKSNRFFNLRRMAMARVEHSLMSSPKPPVILALSEYVKRTIRQYYPAADERLATLFNAVNLDRFDPVLRPETRNVMRERFSIEPDKVVALMIAQDFERKGLREAIAATAEIADPRLVLLVVGRGRTEPYHDLAGDSGIEDRVIFAGPTHDPFSFYAAADFFILPTRHDPCSLVVLEALAMGLPVISTVYNGATEIMTNGTHGFIASDPRDIDTLAAYVRRMLTPSDRQQMSIACLELRRRLSYETHLNELLRIYATAR
jgi:UDP-glucose:(heptosyl)LPS alpha-1,3-glucosyltransferase